MRQFTEAIRSGHYARKQLYCRDPLVAWSHRSRFEIALRLARTFAGRRVLDYGCGDGTFLGLLDARGCLPAYAIGAELKESVVRDCQARLGRPSRLDFVLTTELKRPAHQGVYDAVFCMEVLEHLLEVEPVLNLLTDLLTPTGCLLISVPVETGIPLVVKQTVRRIAGWRGIGDYPGVTPYSMREMFAGLFARSRQHIARPIHNQQTGEPAYDHKGFNWMLLRETLKKRFDHVTTLGSPLVWLTPHLSSQAWLIARKQTSAR